MRSLCNIILQEADVMLLEDCFDAAIPKVPKAGGEVRRRDDKASWVFTVPEGLVIFTSSRGIGIDRDSSMPTT